MKKCILKGVFSTADDSVVELVQGEFDFDGINSLDDYLASHSLVLTDVKELHFQVVELPKNC